MERAGEGRKEIEGEGRTEERKWELKERGNEGRKTMGMSRKERRGKNKRERTGWREERRKGKKGNGRGRKEWMKNGGKGKGRTKKGAEWEGATFLLPHPQERKKEGETDGGEVKGMKGEGREGKGRKDEEERRKKGKERKGERKGRRGKGREPPPPFILPAPPPTSKTKHKDKTTICHFSRNWGVSKEVLKAPQAFLPAPPIPTPTNGRDPGNMTIPGSGPASLGKQARIRGLRAAGGKPTYPAPSARGSGVLLTRPPPPPIPGLAKAKRRRVLCKFLRGNSQNPQPARWEFWERQCQTQLEGVFLSAAPCWAPEHLQPVTCPDLQVQTCLPPHCNSAKRGQAPFCNLAPSEPASGSFPAFFWGGAPSGQGVELQNGWLPQGSSSPTPPLLPAEGRDPQWGSKAHSSQAPTIQVFSPCCIHATHFTH
ncbi:High mobility group nucleosome-binding domain-containing protein 5, partial [Ophiophagus hannah]